MHSIPLPEIALVLALAFTATTVLLAADSITQRIPRNLHAQIWISAILWGWFYWLTH